MDEHSQRFPGRHHEIQMSHIVAQAGLDLLHGESLGKPPREKKSPDELRRLVRVEQLEIVLDAPLITEVSDLNRAEDDSEDERGRGDELDDRREGHFRAVGRIR